MRNLTNIIVVIRKTPFLSKVFIITTFLALVFTASVQAVSTQTVTTTSEFQRGTFSSTEATSKEGEIKLSGNGTWSARVWKTPYATLADGTMITSDSTSTYLLNARDLKFIKYVPSEDKWKTLSNAPHMPYSGADMAVLNNNIYAIFGGYQKFFSKYSITTNTWSELEPLPEMVFSGSSIQTDGTSLYVMRGGTTQDFWKYNPTTDSWTTLTSPPATIGAGAKLVFDNSTGTNYLYTPRGVSTVTMYRYDITANTWSTMANAPATLGGNGNISKKGDYMYVLRGTNTATFYRYSFSGNSWTTLTNTPAATQYVGVSYNVAEDLIYVFRGNSTYDWWKYDPDNGTFVGATDLPAAPGTGADLVYANSSIYLRRGNNSTSFYSLNLSTGSTWATLTSAPAAFNDDNKGLNVGNTLFYFRGSATNTFYRFNIGIGGTGTWVSSGTAPATVNAGASMAYPGSGDYIYGTRGGITTSFWRYSISGDIWSDAAVADLPTDNEIATGSRMVSDGTDIYAITGTGISNLLKYTVSNNTWSTLGELPFSPYFGTDMVFYNGKIYAQSGHYKTDFWEYTVSNNTWRKLSETPGYYANDIGAYNGGSITADTSNGVLYSISGNNITRLLSYTPAATNYPTSGTWTSDPIDLTYVSSWVSLSTSTTTPSDSSIVLETRTSADKSTWSTWATVTGGSISSAAQRYIQVKVTLNSSTGQTATPTLYSFSIQYNGDTTAPTNPSSITGSSQAVSGTAITSGGTYPYTNPYFTWSGASDATSSISGYYVYFGTNASADPAVSGNLQSDVHYTITNPMTTGTYYLRLKTKDSAGNISAAMDAFTYNYNGVSPPQANLYTTSAHFASGTATNMTTSGDEIKLASKAGFWQQQRLSIIPAATSYGTGFAYVSTSNKLYTFRGNSTTTFYEYDIATDTWTARAVAPAIVLNGGDLVEGPSGYLYGIPGRGLNTFWRYDIANNTWSDNDAADSPLAFNYGSSMMFDGSRYIYVLRGNTDDAFMRYDTQADTWDILANVDFGAPSERQNNNVYIGGDLTFDGNETLYAIQGNTYTGFSKYNITTASWSALPDLPLLPYDGAQISYDEDTNAIYFIPGWSTTFLYKYDISTETWSQLPDAPATISAGAAMQKVGSKLYILRGGNTTTFWTYDITKSSWQIPNIGLFGPEFRGTDYRPFGLGANIVKGDGNNYYLVRGNFDNLFTRYNATSGEMTSMAAAPAGFTTGSVLSYDSTNNKIYAMAGQYVRELYVYDIATDTWSRETLDLPPVDPGAGSSMEYDGSRYFYWARGGTTAFYRYDTQASAGSRWSAMANITAAIGTGADIIYENGYIYATRGNTTLNFYRYDVAGNSWNDAAVADLPAGITISTDGFLIDRGNNSLIACRGANTATCYEYSITGNSWSIIANPPANITTGGAAASNGAGSVFVIAGAGTNTFANGLYSYVASTTTTSFQESGNWISPVYDLSSVYKFANINLTYTNATNSSLTLYTRSSTDNNEFTTWTAASELKSIGTSYIYKMNSPNSRYIQLKFEMTSSDGIYSGVVSDYSLNYYQDTSGPTNPTTLSSYQNSSMAVGLTTNNWYSSTAPYFDWPDAEAVGGATDTATGAGIAGYYLYMGTNSTANPYTAGSLITNTHYTGVGLTSGETYYLRILTIDSAGNTAPSVWQPFIYKLDTTRPSNPSTVVADPPGYTATNDFSFSWSGATDSESGIASYCYKTGEVGFVEACTTETSISDIEGYTTGANTFYVRSKDAAGNYSSDYVTSSFYYSSVAPSAPLNLEVDPSSNTVNEYAFSWEPPDIYYGSQAGLRYYYSVNAQPTVNNVNAVGLSVSYLSAGAYATQKGTNDFYVVAKDEAGNIDYNNYATVEFTANTSSPGIPLNTEISDVSVKETESWKIAISWEPPTDTGSGLSTYKVYRSNVLGATCSSNFEDFTYISSTTVKSFVDTDLEKETYGYCVKSCTSTNDCSAPSDTVTLLPDGRWRVAPTLIGEPDAVVKTRTAVISWATGRESSSFVKYGKKSGDYGAEVGSSDLTSDHEIDLVGLDPGVTYYYKVLWTDEDGNTGESDEFTFTTESAPLVSTVTFSNVSLYDAYVNFTVKNAVKATVQYGTSLSYGAVEAVSTSKNESSYTIQLKNLTEGTEYHLRIVAEDNEGNTYNGDDYSFKTLPVPKIENVRVQQVEGMPTATLRLIWTSNTRLSSIITYYPTSKPQLTKDQINLTPKTRHEIILKDMIDETDYTILIKGKDAAGNEAKSTVKEIKTAADLRPPEIVDPNVETTIVGVGENARAQIVISWDTDEGATSQIEYGEGTNGQYTSSSQEDSSLTFNHSMTIPGLTPSKIYHFRVISKDKNGNKGLSQDIVVITPNATSDALNLVVNKLSKTFGFLKNAKFNK